MEYIQLSLFGKTLWSVFIKPPASDFKAVLEAFTATKIPMPPSGRWANAGLVRGGVPDISWRVLDAQYWGSPRLCQRRKRVFLVADFRGTRSAEVLFKSRRLFPNPISSPDGRNAAAQRNRNNFAKAGRVIPSSEPLWQKNAAGSKRGRRRHVPPKLRRFNPRFSHTISKRSGIVCNLAGGKRSGRLHPVSDAP